MTCAECNHSTCEAAWDAMLSRAKTAERALKAAHDDARDLAKLFRKLLRTGNCPMTKRVLDLLERWEE